MSDGCQNYDKGQMSAEELKRMRGQAKSSFAGVTGSAKYRCNLCFRVVTRKSNKRWIPSCCIKHGDVMARLYRISPNEKGQR